MTERKSSTAAGFLLTASKLNLKRLELIRTLVLLAQCAALGYFHQQHHDLDYQTLIIILVLSGLVISLTVFRLQMDWPVTDQEYLGHLLLDILLLSMLLYFSGGATNPFVSYYLVPLSIAAAVLPWRYTWLVAGISVSFYSLLLFFYHPIDILLPGNHAHHSESSGLNLHILGMWLNFMLSAGLITYFVVKMASALRLREQQLSDHREDELRDEQILAVATLAAGTAHELGTPLSTMSILLQELDADTTSDPDLQRDIELLRQQVRRCKGILKNLVMVAEKRSHKEYEPIAIADFIARLIDHWQILRPETQYRYTQQQSGSGPILNVESSLEQAITNLLNNAADACEKRVSITLDWSERNIRLEIRDDGPGIPLHIAEQMGKPFVSTKRSGLGLGLFLSHATINRYGGSIKLFNDSPRGTRVELLLPLSKPDNDSRQRNERESSHE